MEALPVPVSGRLLALVAEHAARAAMLEFAARLAWVGPVRVVDGGNRFNAYTVAVNLRRLVDGSRAGVDVHAALERIAVSRAFTCYQMAALLEGTPPASSPVLVMDFLDTFYDENVPLPERRRLLDGCLAQLRRLSRPAVVVVSLRPPPPGRPDPTGLLERVERGADQVWCPEPPLPPPPLMLF